jgi:hypothetical protein
MGWAEDQRKLLEALQGAEVETIDAVEEAFRGSDGSAPRFRDDRFRFLQCTFVELRLSDGRFARFHTTQGDDGWGIALEMRETTAMAAHWNDSHREGEPSIYRWAPDLGFALGRVETIETRMSDGLVSEVLLSFSGRRVMFKAGDVCEDYSVSEMDENILLFLNADDSAGVTYNPSHEWIRIVGPYKP